MLKHIIADLLFVVDIDLRNDLVNVGIWHLPARPCKYLFDVIRSDIPLVVPVKLVKNAPELFLVEIFIYIDREVNEMLEGYVFLCLIGFSLQSLEQLVQLIHLGG